MGPLTELLGTDFSTWVVSQVRDNQMFVAIVGGMLLGSVLYGLRSIPRKIWNLFLLQFTVVVKIHNDTDSYQEVLAFLSNRGYVGKKTRRLILDKRVSFEVNRLSDESEGFGDDDGRVSDASDSLTLGEGWHFFWYAGRPFVLNHEIGEAKMRERPRTLTLRTLGRSREVMSGFFKEASQDRMRLQKNRLAVYTRGTYDWMRVTEKTKRSLETVILSEEQKSRIQNDIEWFMKSRDWYRERGIPYRRGYLFHGPPGTGKTSLIFALASHYETPVYMLNLSTLKDDNELMSAMGEVPNGVFLLIEDVDAMGARVAPREETPTKQNGDSKNRGEGITLSGFMNALDGVASPDRLVTFMTTNHPDKIEPALLRPGRVDRKEYIGYPEAREARNMFLRFFSDEELANEFEKIFARIQAREDRHLTPADLQELCMESVGDPDEAVRRLREFE